MSRLYRWAEHRIFDAGERAILFGVEQGSLFRIDRETRALMEGAREELLDPNDFALAERATLGGLRDIGMLLPAESGSGAPRTLPDPAEVPLTTLVLEVAQDCNLRCRYCYAAGGSYGQAARLMTPQDARRGVRTLLEQGKDRENLTLILFGGEPLLNLPALEAAVAELEHGRREGCQVSVSLTTNGTLLTPEIVRFLKKHRVSVAVSIDGPEEMHDANRVDAVGGGSYARIVGNLAPLFEGGEVTVAARVTLDPSQWGRVEEVFDHLVGLGFHEVGIAPASPIRPELIATAEQEEALLQGMTALARRFLNRADRGGIPFGNVIDLLARLHQGQTKAVSCGAGFGYLALDAGGDFYLCHRLTGDPAFRVGELETGPDPDRLRGALDRVLAGKDALCRGCWARTLCGGGCHYENELREHHLGLPPGSSCRFILHWLQLGIETYAALHREGGETVLKRLERRARC